MSDDGSAQASQEETIVLVTSGELPCRDIVLRLDSLPRKRQLVQLANGDMPKRQ